MKKGINQILPKVETLYLLSSNSLFFFKSLRTLPDIERWAEVHSAREIAEFFFDSKRKKDKNTFYYFYICLIALSFKLSSESEKYIYKLGKENLRWNNDFVGMIVSQYKPSKIYKCVYPHPPDFKSVSDIKDEKVSKSQITSKVVTRPPNGSVVRNISDKSSANNIVNTRYEGIK